MIRFYETVQEDGVSGHSFSDAEGFEIAGGLEITIIEFLKKNNYPTKFGRDSNISMMAFEELLNEYNFSAPKD